VKSKGRWIKRVEYHVCTTPAIQSQVIEEGLGKGSVWECPCGRQYEVCMNAAEVLYWAQVY
jgi:hypothetical protein